MEWWLRLINKLLHGPGLHCAGPLAFRKIAKYTVVENKKKVLPSERGALGAVPYAESGPGYCMMFIKTLNESLKLELLWQNP